MMPRQIHADTTKRERKEIRPRDLPEPSPLKQLAPIESRIQTKQIVLIEQRALIRECLKRYIEEATDLGVLAVGGVGEWLEGGRSRPTSLFLLSCDRGSPQDERWMQDFASLVAAEPMVPVVLIADGDQLESVMSIIERGGRGYIPINTPLAVAIEAIKLVQAGGVYIPASSLLHCRTVDEASVNVNRHKLSMFTTRQAAVIEALRKGKANKVIAHELSMRESTVKVHVRNIMKRLNAKNRTEVAYLASKLLSGQDE